MGPFAGYEMPISYSGIKKEHNYVRSYGGVFDVSHMGEFIIEGRNVVPFLQKICSNDIEKIKIGKAQYNFFPNENGGIIDDLIVYKIEDNKFLLVVNASNIEKDWQWLIKQNKYYNTKISKVFDGGFEYMPHLKIFDCIVKIKDRKNRIEDYNIEKLK